MNQKPQKKGYLSSWSSDISTKPIAVIGAGLCGLTAAIRLAERGFQVELFESASKAGGRTRSFVDNTTGQLCDNGPHLLIGAYEATQKLLSDCNASHNITWQSSLKLPLWDKNRTHFALHPSPWIPFPLALLLAVRSMPGHGWSSSLAMLRMALAMRTNTIDSTTVSELIKSCRIPARLVDDMLEPLCLGAMNEAIESADASTFKRVLRESFASKESARLGWFNAPLDNALIQPLVKKAEKLGVIIRTRSLVRSVVEQNSGLKINGAYFDTAIIALPAYAADALFDRERLCETRCITNVHLWYKDHPGLPEALIGGINTRGQWFFDVSVQMQQTSSGLRHLCVVISNDEQTVAEKVLLDQLTGELNLICKSHHSPCHYRIIREKRATVLVSHQQHTGLPSSRIIDAIEAPVSGQLPATIEFAVQRGEKAALEVIKLLT